MTDVTIYHNPDCGTLRNTLVLIREGLTLTSRLCENQVAACGLSSVRATTGAADLKHG